MLVRNLEFFCNPIPAADVPGFRFTRNQNGVIVARCMTCRIGFVIFEKDAASARSVMGAHHDWAHKSHLSSGAAFSLDNSEDALDPVMARAGEAGL